MIGTTDTPCAIESQPEASEEDIKFILKEINKFMDNPITKGDILAVWCGIRPLVREMNVVLLDTLYPKKKNTDTKRISRSHEIWSSGDNFFTIAGGKWTTVRNMAEDMCDLIGRTTILPVLVRTWYHIDGEV